jgi:hypothetical protein
MGLVASLGKAPEHKSLDNNNNVHQYYKHYKLPLTMNPDNYGNLIYRDSANNTYLVQITDETVAKITFKNNINNVDLIRKGNIVLTYKDKKIHETSFERTIGLNNYTYIKSGDNYQLELFNVVKSSRFIKAKAADTKINS